MLPKSLTVQRWLLVSVVVVLYPGQPYFILFHTVSVSVCVSGRMYLFYGNKTSVQFASFSTTVSCPGELQSHILSRDLYFTCTVHV